ncbi:MAG: PAS domain S-box protein [Deltaproteobacteria bacterium]|nr:PAS domain S-box protein [Deltaproteobacteria bacterium]
MGKSIFLRHIENNGLIIISIGVAVIYWLFDALFAGVVFTRLLMIVLFIAYGAFTQFLINSHKDIELALKKAHDGLEEQVKIRTAELIKVNEELKKSERLFHTLAQLSPVGIFRTDAKGDYVYVNERWSKISGMSMDEALGDGWAKAIHPEERERVAKEWYGSVQENRLFNSECRFQRTDGVSTWMLCQATAEINSAEEITGYVGTITDITERKHSFDRMRKALGATVKAIALVVETRDPYTAGHQKRVVDLARAIAQEMGLSADRVDGIRMAGVIHDIGKIAVPAEILSKPTKLREVEFSLIKIHPEAGYEILKEIESPGAVDQIIFQHHERVDGSGYPQGLCGEEILLEARILAVADVVEAIASHRPYRPSLGIEKAIEEISKNKGIYYDSNVVDACLKLFHEKGYKMEI